MKLVTFEHQGRTAPGLLEGQMVAALGGGFPDLGALLEAGALDSALRARRPSVPLAEVRLLAPVPRPAKLVGVGLNYCQHAREQGQEPPASPMFFGKARNCVVGPDQPILLPPGRDQIDVEVELAVVIGRPGFRIPPGRVLDHVLGFTILNDVSDRQAQSSDGQFYRAKSWATFGPMGPWIATPDELDWSNLPIRLRLNGRLQQDSTTADMTHSATLLVELLSQVHGLEAGDVIATGTPSGVGVHRNPPVFLRDGDVVECEISGLGALRNPVRQG